MSQLKGYYHSGVCLSASRYCSLELSVMGNCSPDLLGSSTWFFWSVEMFASCRHTDIGAGFGALPLNDIKFGPFFNFPAVAVDNCTRAPVEPAVEECPGLNLQTESPCDCLVGFPFNLSAQNLFYSGTVEWCVMPQFNNTRFLSTDKCHAHSMMEKTYLVLLPYFHSLLHFSGSVNTDWMSTHAALIFRMEWGMPFYFISKSACDSK